MTKLLFSQFLTDMESFNPANYEILYGCVQHMCDCFADYSPDPENAAECQKIEEFEETWPWTMTLKVACKKFNQLEFKW